jgi:hypothetical protein
MSFFSEPYNIVNPPADVAHGFTRDGLRALAHHVHPMAFIRGAVEPFVRKHWPGLTFEQAMSLTSAAGVWANRRHRVARLELADHVEEFHILLDGTTRVVERAESDHATTPNQQVAREAGLLVDVTSYYDATPEQQREILRQLLGRIAPR